MSRDIALRDGLVDWWISKIYFVFLCLFSYFLDNFIGSAGPVCLSAFSFFTYPRAHTYLVYRILANDYGPTSTINGIPVQEKYSMISKLPRRVCVFLVSTFKKSYRGSPLRDLREYSSLYFRPQHLCHLQTLV